MGCCGSTQKVRKVVILPEHRPVEPPKTQIREDDVIQMPKNQRKLFRVDFDLKTVLSPEYLILRSFDYSSECTQVELLVQMVRQQIREIDSQMRRQENSNIQKNEANTNKFEESTQANNRIAEKEIHVQVIDDLIKKPDRREEFVMN